MKTEWSLHGITHLLWTFSHVSKVCFASLISWRNLLVPCKSKLHRLSFKLCHFIALKFEPHHSLLNGVVSHHVSEIWTMSTSSKMMIDYISKVGVASSLLYGYVRAMSKFLVACFNIFKVLAACFGIFKVLTSFFSPHLQSLDKDSLHLQDFVGNSLHLQRLVGIAEILMSDYNAMHPRCLSYVASEYWCNFNASAKMDVGMASVWMKCWSGFTAKMDVGTTLVQMKCWHGFSANDGATS